MSVKYFFCKQGANYLSIQSPITESIRHKLFTLLFLFKVDPSGQSKSTEMDKANEDPEEAAIDCIDLNETDYESVTTVTSYRSASPQSTVASEFADPDHRGRSKVGKCNISNTSWRYESLYYIAAEEPK